MKIDLGAIAKGFAADQVALYLKASDVEKAIINLGGNIKTIGDFSIGLKNLSKTQMIHLQVLR